MSRAYRREIKKTFQKDIIEFLKIQRHFLPDLIKNLGEINDPVNGKYFPAKNGNYFPAVSGK